jgi:hypothetical protein
MVTTFIAQMPRFQAGGAAAAAAADAETLEPKTE